MSLFSLKLKRKSNFQQVLRHYRYYRLIEMIVIIITMKTVGRHGLSRGKAVIMCVRVCLAIYLTVIPVTAIYNQESRDHQQNNNQLDSKMKMGLSIVMMMMVTMSMIFHAVAVHTPQKFCSFSRKRTIDSLFNSTLSLCIALAKNFMNSSKIQHEPIQIYTHTVV